jgi:aminoglycoside phosphotransferase (APT) family kinase protein
MTPAVTPAVTPAGVDDLRPWFAARFDASVVDLVDVRRHTEGFSWQTYTFDVVWTDGSGERHRRGVAVRRQPEDGLLAPYDVVGQYRLQAVLARSTPVPVPDVIDVETDPSVFGMPFFAMERVDGIVPVQWQGDDPTVFPDEHARRRIGIDFVDTLAAIHAVDVTESGLDAVVPGPGNSDVATAEIDRWEMFLDDAVVVEVPLLRAAIAWCRANRATSGHVGLCHGDYRIGNFMVADGRINAVFDWELAHIGDPVEDLAWAGLRLFRGRSPLVSQLLSWDETIDRYAERTGLVVDGAVLRFWTVLGMVKAAAPHIRAARAFEDGRSDDLRLAAMGHQTLHVLRQLADEIGIARIEGVPA